MDEINKRFDKLDAMVREGRVLRGSWTQGRERACLLAAISPEVANTSNPSKCPAFLLPQWFAHLTPSMDDNGSLEKWGGFVERYARVVRLAALSLDASGWERAEFRVKLLATKEAMRHAKDAQVLSFCEAVCALLERAIAGEDIPNSEWEEVRGAARWAADAARAAEAARWTADAAWAAARWGAEAAGEAPDAARRAAAWDRMNEGILDALQTEIDLASKEELVLTFHEPEQREEQEIALEKELV